jgi:predicted NUDIX family NTP pyrophosphohydrolase
MKQSAGILLYRKTGNGNEVFLVHPGGPFWKNKDAGAWSIPKGEYEKDEEPLIAARREFLEETGIEVNGDFIKLEPVKLRSGKIVHAWALEKNIDASSFQCASFIEIEWPPRSGKKISVPEVDKGEWFPVKEAITKINPAQVALINELKNKIIS